MPAPRYQKKNTKSQFPAPRYMTVRDTEDHQEAIHFFKYWADLGDLSDLADVKVYRSWPRIDVRLTDPDRKTIETKILHGAIPFQPAEYREYFKTQFGSGGWRVIMNERGVAGKVMECFFTAKSSPLDEAMPKIDPRTVLNEFENKNYIDCAHAQGIIFPWEQDQEAIEAARTKEEDDTMTGEVVKGLTDMAERVVQSASEKAQLATEKAQLESELKVRDAEAGREKKVSSDGVTESIRLVTGTAEKMVEMVTKNAGVQFNPVELINTVAALNKNDTEGVKVLATAFEKSVVEMRSMHETTLKFFGEQITQISTSTQRQTVTTVERKTFLEEYEEFQKKAELFGFRRGEETSVAHVREHEETPQAPPQKGFMQSIVENLPAITGLVQMVMIFGANMFHNAAVARSGQGKAEAPEEAVARARQAQAAAPQQPQPTQPHQPVDPRQIILQIVDQQIFKTGFINHFFTQECDGHTFAEFVNTEGTMAAPTPNGRRIYMMLRDIGRDNFDMVIRGNGDIWSKVQGMPAHYDKFIDDFIDYDEWASGDDEEPPAEKTGQAA